MARLLLIVTALVAAPAHADPITVAGLVISAASAAGVANAAAIGVYLGVSATVATVGVVVASGLASIGIALAVKPSTPRPPELIRDLGRAQSIPPKRFVYGRFKVYGTPAPYVVEGGVLYGCLILNSRPSQGGTVALAIDKTPVELSGDLFDFDGDGAAPTESPFAGYAKFWLGLGDQTQPPQAILDDTDSPFQASDAWRGLTVLWVRLDAGPSRDRAERWKRVPPDIEVEMDWSKVFDPRDPAQDAADPETWAFSRTRALVALDALLANPARPYPLDQIDVAGFVAAADSDDEAVALKAGGTEPRYRADGVVVWSGAELEDLIAPIAAAGAGQLARVGGRLTMTRGVYETPHVTLSDVLGDEMSVEMLKPGRDLASVVACRYVAPDRDWEMADLAHYEVPGAEGEAAIIDMELPWVTSPTQAMRVQKITALRQRSQRRLRAVFPPSALPLTAGATATLALPSPYETLNGVYECQNIAPVATVSGDGVAMRCPAELVETGPEIYAWSPEEDEQDIEEGVAVALDRPPVAPPLAPLLLTTGASAALNTGDAVLPRVLARWTPSLSARAIGYEAEYRSNGGDWLAGASVDISTVDGDGYAYAYLGPLAAGASVDVRVRSVAPGAVSVWLEGGPIVVAGPDVTLNAPTGGDAIGGDDQISVSFVAPNDADFRGIEFWGADADATEGAALIAGPIYGPANSVYGYTETGLSAGQTRFYFARSVGPFGAASAFSASASATTNL